MKKTKFWILVFFISFLFGILISGAMGTNTQSGISSSSANVTGYYIIHWPVNGEVLRVYR